MSSIQDVMEEINKTKAIAEMDPGTNVQTRRVRMGKIKQAKSKLEELYMEYRKEVRNNSIFIVASGTEAQGFADSAKKDFDCFTLQADSFYENLLDQVPDKLYLNKPASRNMFEHLSARLEDRAREIDIIGYNGIYFEGKYKRNLKTKEDALQITKEAINKKVGAEIVGLDAIERISIESVNKGFQGTTVPIVLYTNDEKLTQDLLKDLKRLTKNVFFVKSGDIKEKSLTALAINDINKATKENVKETLLKIKSNIN